MYRFTFFLTSAVAGAEWSASRPCRFTPGEIASGTYLIGGRIGLRIGLKDVQRRKILPLPGLKLLAVGRPALSRLPDCINIYLK
jgi:hypothetical protein